MKYRQLDESGDYVLGRRNHFLTGSAAVAQAIRTRLLMFFGEWWENVEDGTPWFEEVLATFHGDDSRAGIDLMLSERISGTTGVTEIVSFESNYNVGTRTYAASCEVKTEYSEIVVVQIGASQRQSEFYTVKTHIKGVAA